ncbi:MAG: DUF1573 domain-containing protein [Nitrospirae bacterium]|nr:DUF1573 domain-containing protein [Nitrospirota bacterium]
MTYNSGNDPVLKPGEEVLKSVEVWTNDPKRKMIILALQGRVEISESPKIEFRDTTYDFGSVNEGEIVSHDFVFRNNGKKMLSIEKIIPS